LALVNELLVKEERKLARWKEMYADGIISKEELIDAKAKSDQTISSLSREHADLVATIDMAEITDQEIQDIVDEMIRLKQEALEGLDIADAEFDERRWFIERLNVTATLRFENGQKIVDARCKLGKKSFSIASYTIFGAYTNHRGRAGGGYV
jgi:hypothetical protein